MSNTIAFPSAQPIDASDVAVVTARELAFAVKLLGSIGGTLATAASLTEDDIRQVEDFYWQQLGRPSARKTAVLLRFRALADVCRARRINALIVSGGADAISNILTAAANLRLNTVWGFNPQKLASAAAALQRRAAAPAAQFAAAA